MAEKTWTDPDGMAVLIDEEAADCFLGKLILAGITYVDDEGCPIEQRQYAGRVLRINNQEGMVIRLEDSGEEYRLPPILEHYHRADPGEYTLRSTGRVVTDPDYLTTFDVVRPELQ